MSVLVTGDGWTDGMYICMYVRLVRGEGLSLLLFIRNINSLNKNMLTDVILEFLVQTSAIHTNKKNAKQNNSNNSSAGYLIFANFRVRGQVKEHRLLAVTYAMATLGKC